MIRIIEDNNIVLFFKDKKKDYKFEKCFIKTNEAGMNLKNPKRFKFPFLERFGEEVFEIRVKIRL